MYGTEKNGLQQRQQAQLISLPGWQLWCPRGGKWTHGPSQLLPGPVSSLSSLSICLPLRDHRIFLLEGRSDHFTTIFHHLYKCLSSTLLDKVSVLWRPSVSLPLPPSPVSSSKSCCTLSCSSHNLLCFLHCVRQAPPAVLPLHSCALHLEIGTEWRAWLLRAPHKSPVPDWSLCTLAQVKRLHELAPSCYLPSLIITVSSFRVLLYFILDVHIFSTYCVKDTLYIGNLYVIK